MLRLAGDGAGRFFRCCGMNFGTPHAFFLGSGSAAFFRSGTVGAAEIVVASGLGAADFAASAAGTAASGSFAVECSLVLSP